MAKNSRAAKGLGQAEPMTYPPASEVPPIEVSSEAKPRLGRRLALAGARGTVGIIGVGVASLSIAAATLIPLPMVGVGPTSTLVSPAPATQQRICAGPVLQLGNDAGQDATTAISVGTTQVTFASTTGTPRLENMVATENASNTPAQQLLLAPPPADATPGVLAGSQTQFAATPEMTGFAASECTKPSTESWLVGGSTVTGRTTLLSLNNPSQVSSTVKLTIYSESGLVEAAGTEGIVVPPGGRSVVSLAGFAPGAKSLVVHVESVGGQVSAALQQSIVRTLTPGGVDVISDSADPSTQIVIPGVVVTGQSAVASASTIDGYGDLAGVLRVFVPGSGTATVTVTAQPEDAASAPSTSVFQVPSGLVTDFPLGVFTDGSWTFSLTSDLPMIAGVRTSTVTLNTQSQSPAAETEGQAPTSAAIVATDFAWFSGAPQLAKSALVSVAPGPDPLLHLVNSGTADQIVQISPLTGGATTVTVPARGSLAVPVNGNSSYRLDGFNALQISVSYSGAGALAGFTVSPPDRAAQAITVFNQYG